MKTQSIFKAFAALLLTATLSACGHSSNSPHEQGGSDSGGGNVIGTSQKDFQTLTGDLSKYAAITIKRAELLSSAGEFDSDVLKTFLADANGLSIEQLLAKVTWQIQDDDCPSKDGLRSGSADPTTDTICISYNSFKDMSHADAIDQITALSLHELSHLKGFDEPHAVALQTFFLENADLLLGIKSTYMVLSRHIDNLLATITTIQGGLISGARTDYCDESMNGQFIDQIGDAGFDFAGAKLYKAHDSLAQADNAAFKAMTDLCALGAGHRLSFDEGKHYNAIFTSSVTTMKSIETEFATLTNPDCKSQSTAASPGGELCQVSPNFYVNEIYAEYFSGSAKQVALEVAPSSVDCSLVSADTRAVLKSFNASDASAAKDIRVPIIGGDSIVVYFWAEAGAEIPPSVVPLMVQRTTTNGVPVTYSQPTRGEFLFGQATTWLSRVNLQASLQITVSDKNYEVLCALK